MKAKRNSSVVLLLIVLFIYPLPQLAIDLYLPSWQSMGVFFHTSHEHIKTTLVIYLMSLGLSQIIYGPLSDKYGRKPMLLIGLCIFSVGTLCVFITHTIMALYLIRFIQGIGLGCGFSVASATLADLFTGKKLAAATSYSAMIFSISVIFAPVAGGYIQHHWGWQANFLAMLIYSIILMLLIACCVPETHKKTARHTMTLKQVGQLYAGFFIKPRFIGNILALTLAYGFVVAFNVVSPFLFLKTLHVAAFQYGILLGLVGLSYFMGSTINSFLIKRFSMRAVVNVGLLLMMCGSLVFLCLAYMHTENAYAIIATASCSVLGVGLVYPNCFARALDVYDEKGTAGAFIGAAAPIGTGIISAILARTTLPDILLLGVSYFIMTALTYAVIFWSRDTAKRVASSL
jgi:MFS transporter, DHA1 family, 2-module integral membrane pump EmrD